MESFGKKDSTKPRKSQAVTRGLGSNTLPLIFSGDLWKVYRKIFLANVRDFYTLFLITGWGKLLTYYVQIAVARATQLCRPNVGTIANYC